MYQMRIQQRDGFFCLSRGWIQSRVITEQILFLFSWNFEESIPEQKSGYTCSFQGSKTEVKEKNEISQRVGYMFWCQFRGNSESRFPGFRLRAPIPSLFSLINRSTTGDWAKCQSFCKPTEEPLTKGLLASSREFPNMETNSLSGWCIHFSLLP